MKRGDLFEVIGKSMEIDETARSGFQKRKRYFADQTLG